MSDATIKRQPCPAGCGGEIAVAMLEGLFGEGPLPVKSKCPVCEERRERAARQSAQQERLAEMRVGACCQAPYVYPSAAPRLQKVIEATHDGFIGGCWILGGPMSGRTTIAKAWVHSMIESGRAASYIDMVEFMRLPAKDVAAYLAQRTGEHLALDGFLQNEAALQPWEIARVADLLTNRGGSVTLVTSPINPRDNAIATLAGPGLAKRITRLVCAGVNLEDGGR